MKKQIFLSFVGILLLGGCSTVSQNNAFGEIVSETRTRGIENLHWIKTPQEAASINKSVHGLLSSPLTQKNAVRIALINNRSLQKSYEKIGITQSELVQAGLMSNPLLGYKIGHSGSATEATIGIEMAFLDLVWIPMRQKLAGLELAKTQWEVGDEILKTVRDTKQSYIEVRILQEKVDMYVPILKSHEASVQLAIRQNTAGNLSKRDFLKIQDAYEHARMEAMEMKRENAKAREALNRLLGLYGSQTKYTLSRKPLPLPRKKLKIEGLENKAIADRLDMRAAIVATDYAAAQAGYAQKTHLLSEITVGAERETVTQASALNSFGIAIPIPLFDLGQGRISKTQALYNQSIHHLYETAVNIRSEVRQKYAQWRYSYDKANEYDRVIVKINQQILEETQLYYNGMLDGIYELLEDQRRVVETKIEALEALGELHKAQADLEYTIGGKLR